MGLTMHKKNQRLVLDMLGIILNILINIIFYIAVVFVILRASKEAYDFAYQVFGSRPATPGEIGVETVIEIKKGESTMTIANELERRGIILNKYAFYVRAKLSKTNIIPGKYKLNSSMDYDEIFVVITKTVKESEGVQR